MAIRKINESTLTDIADAIRAKTGGSALINPEDMATEIESIPSGGTTITDGLVVTEWKTPYWYRGSVPKSVVLHTNGMIHAAQFANQSSETAYHNWYIENFTHVPHAPLTFIDNQAFYNCPWVTKEIAESIMATVQYVNQDIFPLCSGIVGNVEFPNLEEFNDYAKTLSLTYSNRNGGLIRECKNITGISCPKLMHVCRDFARACTSLETVYLPKCSVLVSNNSGRGAFHGCTKLKTVQLGSIGTSCEVLYTYDFTNCTQATLTITIYCTGSLVDNNVSRIRAGATNATIIVKASENTTYNGASFSAGDTILTSTP